MGKVKKYLSLFSLGISVLFLALFAVEVRNVKCSNQYGKCSRAVERAVGQVLGESIKSAPNKLEAGLSGINVIEESSVRYQPPDGFEVFVLEKKGELAVKFSDSKMYNIVTVDLEKISESETTQLPTLFIQSDKYDLGSEQTKYAVEMLSALSRYFNFNSLTLSDNKLIGMYNDIQVIYPLNKDIDVVLGSLELLLFQLNPHLQNLKIEDKPERIDLRFKNAVVK